MKKLISSFITAFIIIYPVKAGNYYEENWGEVREKIIEKSEENMEMYKEKMDCVLYADDIEDYEDCANVRIKPKFRPMCNAAWKVCKNDIWELYRRKWMNYLFVKTCAESSESYGKFIYCLRVRGAFFP